MKKSEKSILYLTIIILSIAIFILIGIIINISNKEIKKQEKSESLQLTETSELPAYVNINTHLSEVTDATKVEESVAAIADNITEGKKAWVNGQLITGNGIDNINYKNNALSQVYYLGKGRSFNIATLFPNIDYTTVTVDNFLVSDISFSEKGTYVSYSKNAYSTVYGKTTVTSASYNNTTGELTISGSIDAYCAVGSNSSDTIHKSTNYSTDVAPAVWFSPNGFAIENI